MKASVAPDRYEIPVTLMERVQIAVLVIILFGLMSIIYRDLVSARYFFGSFTYEPFGNNVVVYTLLVANALAVSPRVRGMADLFLLLSTIFLLLPALVLAQSQNSPVEALLTFYGAVFGVFAFAAVARKQLEKKGIEKPLRVPFKVFMLPVFVFVGAVLFYLAIHVNFAFNLSFAEVYDNRLDFNESLEFPLNYLLPLAAGSCISFVVAVAIEKTRLVYLAFTVVMGILFFGFSTHKAFLFYPVFSAAGYFLVRWRWGARLFVLGIISLCLLTLAATGPLMDIMGSSFANRLIFIPAQIHYFYLEVFDEVGFQYWAESRLSFGLVRPNLPVPSVYYIGEQMTGYSDIGANTGWIANGYMNAGVVGLMIYGFIVTAMLIAFDWLGARYGLAFVAAAFFTPLYSLVNASDLFVALLTGGLGILGLIFIGLVRPILETPAFASPQFEKSA